MIDLLLDYGALVIATYYIYNRLLKPQEKKLSYCLFLPVEICYLAFTSYALSKLSAESNLYFFTYSLFVVTFSIFFIITSLEKPTTIFVTTTLSFVISFSCCTFSKVSAQSMTELLWNLYPVQTPILTPLLQVVLLLLSLLICRMLFGIRKFQKFLSALKNPRIADRGFFLSASLMLLGVILSALISLKQMDVTNLFLLLIPLTLAASIALFFWWESKSQQIYLKAEKEQDYRMLENYFNYCKEYTSELEQEARELSYLIHRDNKYIPTMQLAVRDLFSSDSFPKEKADHLLTQLDAELSQRQAMLTKLSFHDCLPSMGLPLVDQILRLFDCWCKKENLTFHLDFCHNISSITDSVSEQDLRVLLYNLLENAFTATKSNEGGSLSLSIHYEDGLYTIDLLDSGIAFSQKSLLSLGKKTYSTCDSEEHQGMGLMRVYRILQKYHASLVIDETDCLSQEYTKKVSVAFDQKGEYHLKTKRSRKELTTLSHRRDLVIHFF